MAESERFSNSLTPLQRTWALLGGRCPRCGRGAIFRGRWMMNDPCPVCGLIFQREEGYFLGAMYASYALGSILMMGGYFLGRWLLPSWDSAVVCGVVFALYLFLVPAVFRYSRIIWIHFERWLCPSDASAGSFEKAEAQRARVHQPASSENHGTKEL